MKKSREGGGREDREREKRWIREEEREGEEEKREKERDMK